MVGESVRETPAGREEPAFPWHRGRGEVGPVGLEEDVGEDERTFTLDDGTHERWFRVGGEGGVCGIARAASRSAKISLRRVRVHGTMFLGSFERSNAIKSCERDTDARFVHRCYYSFSSFGALWLWDDPCACYLQFCLPCSAVWRHIRPRDAGRKPSLGI